MKNARSKLDSTQADLQSKLSDAQTSLSQLQDAHRQTEGELKDTRQMLERKTFEYDTAIAETQSLRQGNQALDQTKFSQERSITE